MSEAAATNGFCRVAQLKGVYMYDDNFDLWNDTDVSYTDVSIMEDSFDDVSGTDFVSDPWLDPLFFRSPDVSSSDISETDSLVEVDLSQIEYTLQSIDKYCNLLFTLCFFYIAYRFIRSIVYKFNSKGKGLDE